MKYYRDVVLPMYNSGEIIKYELQKQFELQPKFVYNGETISAITYIADFVLYYPDDHKEVIEIKGKADSAALIKRKMFRYKYPDVIYKWLTLVQKYGGWCDYDYVKKCRSAAKKEK